MSFHSLADFIVERLVAAVDWRQRAHVAGYQVAALGDNIFRTMRRLRLAGSRSFDYTST